MPYRKNKQKTYSLMPQNSKPFNRMAQLLVVEDDPTFLKFFKIHLNRYFSKVHVVENGRDAKKWLDQNHVDLIITDIHMPKLNGFELNKHVLTNFPDIPIIAITGAILSEEEEDILQNRFEEVLFKPFEFDQFDTAIQKSIGLANLYHHISTLLEPEHRDSNTIWGKDFDGFPIRDPSLIEESTLDGLSDEITSILNEIASARKNISDT